MMDLITGHQGVAHISAVQVATLNNKLTGDIGEHKVMRITGGTVTKNGLTLEIATGYWRVNGYDMEITEAETVYFDPSTVGLKRIDGVYVEILRDIASGVERAEIIVVKGEEGVSPVAPSAPTAPEYTTDILHQCELVGEVEVNENTMTLTDATIEYKISSGGAESLAPQFDENTSYSVGDVVEYDGKLYVFTSAHTGAWNASHVSETTVNALLANKADIPVSISQGGTGSTTAPQARSNLGAASDTTVGKIYNIIRQVSDDAYKTTKAYKAGDYVIYDDKLYKCTSACTAGSWATNSSHFTQDTLTNAVSQLNNDLSKYIQLYSYSSGGYLSAKKMITRQISSTTNSNGDAGIAIPITDIIFFASVSAGINAVPRVSSDGSTTVAHCTSTSNQNVANTSINFRIIYLG